jgi:hypothetical protein
VQGILKTALGWAGSTVWDALAQVLNGLDKLLLQAPDIHRHYAAFVSSIVKPAAAVVSPRPER